MLAVRFISSSGLWVWQRLWPRGQEEHNGRMLPNLREVSYQGLSVPSRKDNARSPGEWRFQARASEGADAARAYVDEAKGSQRNEP